jgi:hypothetical protein
MFAVMIRPPAFLLALALCAAAPLAAQRPDFSGTWVRVDSAPSGRGVAATGDAAFRTGDMGSGWGSPLTITQTGERLNVVFDFFIAYDLQPKVRYAYALDGSASKNIVPVGPTETVTRSTASWEGAVLVITTSFPAPPGVSAPPGALELRQSLALDATGRLVIEARRRGANGAVNTVVSTYTRR